MIPLLPLPEPELRTSLRNVLERAIASGAHPPPWVAVDDGRGEWWRLAGSRPVGERARAVAVVGDEDSVLNAMRLGLGGALWMPPSTVTMTAALRAAHDDQAAVCPLCDPQLVDLVGGVGAGLTAVTWCNRQFWRLQLGDTRLVRLLVGLADALDVLPAILPLPALLVPGAGEDEILAAYQRLTAEQPPVPSQGLIMAAVDPATLVGGAACAAQRAIAARDDGAGECELRAEPLPVCELPSGQRVGYWAPLPAHRLPTDGWHASPEEPSGAGLRWRLRRLQGDELEVQDVTRSGEIPDGGGHAVRLAGWMAQSIRPGSPSGLLVEHLLRSCDRRGVRLWVPNVDDGGLRLLLRLRGPLWVDGPAVPG